MNEKELRVLEIKETFDCISKNHEQTINIFKEYYLSKVEFLEDDEYLNMKSWLKEYSRILNLVKTHLTEFEEYGHQIEHPDQDKMIKQALGILYLLNMQS